MYTLPVREFFVSPLLRRSCKAARLVTARSSMCSGISLPSSSVTASVYRCIPTFRTRSTVVPGSRSSFPAGVDQTLSVFIRRVIILEPFCISTLKLRFISPAHVRYTCTLSSASTAATESSQSAMAVRADSTTTSLMPAMLDLPMLLLWSMTISKCSPLLRSSTLLSSSPSLRKPANCFPFLRVSCFPLSYVTVNLPSEMENFSTWEYF
mmetsp:Transcript_26179/g.86104  ORF Transcript_26179/g.86104 Transcript_26179/m.86104 type:complete len:209 (-) Transcript_26179:719-1345(-)